MAKTSCKLVIEVEGLERYISLPYGWEPGDTPTMVLISHQSQDEIDVEETLLMGDITVPHLIVIENLGEGTVEIDTDFDVEFSATLKVAAGEVVTFCPTGDVYLLNADGDDEFLVSVFVVGE